MKHTRFEHTRLPIRLPILLGGALAAFLFLVSIILTLLAGFSPRLLALDVGQAIGIPVQICANETQPSADLCNNQDPILEGCSADAHTTARADIIENGQVVGRLERRHSPRCHTYWGRLFDFRPQKHPLTLQIGPDIASFGSNHTEVYSNMVLVPTPQDQIPAMVGLLTLDAQDPLSLVTNALVAQLPALMAAKEA